MNREIKFRMWNKAGEYSRMFYKTDEVMECLKQQIEFNVDGKSGYDHEGDGSAFMQYTGLKDKNNKDIYEGDIVQGYENGIKIGTDEIVFKNGRFNFKDTPSDLVYWIYSFGVKEIEVIGNIHEHPQLIKTHEQPTSNK